MTRVLMGALWAGLLALALSSTAEARPKKKRKRARDRTPSSEQIVVAMKKQGIRWGMDKGEVAGVLRKQIKERYRPLIRKTRDPVEEDRLREEAKDELKRIKASYVEFSGRTTGWDVSFLRDEFTHGNDEAMMVVRDQNSQNFFFFINGRLWKWYKAFDAAVFAAGSFDNFARAVQRKFGESSAKEGQLAPGAAARRWLEWQDGDTRLRAVDETEFYGFYCLVFDDKGTVSRLAELRRNDDRRRKSKHSIVDAVTSGDVEDADDSPNVVDRITGKYRVREQAPARGTDRGGSSKAKARRSAPSTTDLGDDDPLQGL